MRFMKRQRVVAVVAALTLAVVATVAAHAQARPLDASSPGVTALRECDGGAQLQSLVTTQNSPSTIGESPAVALVGAERTFRTTEENHQVRITFAAEALLVGASFNPAGPDDSLVVEIRLDDLRLPGPSDLAFATGPLASANATLVCAEVSPGPHTVQVFWQVSDTGANNVLTGRLDDWALDVQIND